MRTYDELRFPFCITSCLTAVGISACCRMMDASKGTNSTIICNSDTLSKHWYDEDLFRFWNIIIDENEIDLVIR